MIRYSPLECGVYWQGESHLADLRSFDWAAKAAEWVYPDGKSILRVQFSGMLIVRILDDFAMSEDMNSGQHQGLVGEHFAYVVEGDAFNAAQSESWKTVAGSTRHYRFITGNGCMDVISDAPPTFHTQRL